MSFGLLHLAPALGGFMSAHPGLTIDIDLNDRRVDVIEEGFDVVVRIGRLADSSLIARRLARVRLVLTASPDYLALHGTPRTVEDLSLHRRLTYAIGGARQRWTCRTPDGREVQIDLADRMIANNGDILGCAAEAGLGLALNPTFIAHRAIEEGRLVPLLTDHSWPSIDAYALYPPGRHLSAKVRAFIDFLADRFGDPPYWDRCLEASTAAGGA